MEQEKAISAQHERAEHGAEFLTTRWSVVLSARDAEENSEQGLEALESLCRSYWIPLYCFVRRQGHDKQQAEDYTQGFFQRLLEKQTIAGVDRSKGKFRSYLLACLKNYILDEHKHETRLKRGGGVRMLSLDADIGEQELASTGSSEMTPEQIFDRRWGLTLMATALKKLEGEHSASEKSVRFALIKPYLMGEMPAERSKQICEELAISKNNLQVIVHRIRQRYRELIRAEVADTVANPSEVNDEMRYLSSVIAAQKTVKNV